MVGGVRLKLIAKLRRDKRGLSPIFAVLILIAIAVIAAIVVYMFTSGYLGTMMGGGTTGQEKVAVESVQYTGGVAGSLTVWAKSVGGGTVNIDAIIIRNADGNQVGAAYTFAVVPLPSVGTLTPIGPQVLGGLVVGETYTAAIVSMEGGQFLSAAFTA
jgi:flagellin-like protein